MGKMMDALDDYLTSFIDAQHVFFVATAAADGRVNLSPKGLDSLKVLTPNRVVWLNLTGSGNETAAHVLEVNRITLMFCAFEGPPLILRLYGKAKCHHPRDPEWKELESHFTMIPGARQIVDVEIESVQTSCGFGVPFMDFKGDRDTLEVWGVNKGQEGVEKYWSDKNRLSIDGKPTHIIV